MQKFDTIQESLNKTEKKTEIIEITDVPLSELHCESDKVYVIENSVYDTIIRLPICDDSICHSIILYFETSGSKSFSQVQFKIEGAEDCDGILVYSNFKNISAGENYEVNCFWNGNNWILGLTTLQSYSNFTK